MKKIAWIVVLKKSCCVCVCDLGMSLIYVVSSSQ